jgi:transposase
LVAVEFAREEAMGEREADGEKRRMRTKAERRRIVEETLEPGASVARVARAHGVNANQVFKWRKLYREGRLGPKGPGNALVPVRVRGTARRTGRRSSPERTRAAGTIDIDLGHARVRIQGTADPACVRAALEGLVR